jgi:hypothetical protein
MFAREHELVAALAAHHRRLWPAAHSRRVKAERGYGRGVADLVILDFDDCAQRCRAQAGLPPLQNDGQAYIVAGLRAVGYSTRAAAGRLDRMVGERTNRRILAELVKAGYVLEDEVGYRLHPEMLAPVKRIVAIEAKLTDWRGGLEQAARYRVFADQSYLALPAPTAERLARSEWAPAIRQLGVGVIAVGSRSKILISAHAGIRRGDEGVRVWAEESEFSDAVGEPRRLVKPFPARFASPTPDQLVADA